MANYKFYTQNETLRAATATATVGTASSVFPLSNALNFRPQSVAKAATISGGGFAWYWDCTSSITINWCAIIGHNLYSGDATHNVTLNVSGSATSGGVYTDACALEAIDAATDEPVFYPTTFVSIAAKQFWKFAFAGLDSATACYWGCILAGDADDTFLPSVDPSLPIVTGYLRDGIQINENWSGSRYSTRRAGRRRTWGLRYDLINSNDKTIFENFEEKIEGPRFPFVFTDGTSYYYGRLTGPMEIRTNEQTSDLFHVSFTIEEEI